jgi:hypothetical protein
MCFPRQESTPDSQEVKEDVISSPPHH